MLEWSPKERRRAACRQLAKPCLIDFRESYESTRYGLRYSSAAGASASPNNLDELISTRSRGSLFTTLSCVHWHSTAQHSLTARQQHLRGLAINRSPFGSKLPSSITHCAFLVNQMA